MIWMPCYHCCEHYLSTVHQRSQTWLLLGLQAGWYHIVSNAQLRLLVHDSNPRSEVKLICLDCATQKTVIIVYCRQESSITLPPLFQTCDCAVSAEFYLQYLFVIPSSAKLQGMC